MQKNSELGEVFSTLSSSETLINSKGWAVWQRKKERHHVFWTKAHVPASMLKPWSSSLDCYSNWVWCYHTPGGPLALPPICWAPTMCQDSPTLWLPSLAGASALWTWYLLFVKRGNWVLGRWRNSSKVNKEMAEPRLEWNPSESDGWPF